MALGNVGIVLLELGIGIAVGIRKVMVVHFETDIEMNWP
jgi:hypothetical protein